MLLLASPPESEEYLDELTYYWGGVDQGSMLRALAEGDERDRLFALHALGYLGTDEAHRQLLAHLESERPLERWASAIGLGRMREERALPALVKMLTEFLPPDQEYRASPYYRGWRFFAPLILGAWGKPEAIPGLRGALRAAMGVESALPAPPDESARYTSYSEREDWVRYQDELVYALGRLDAFGALTGVEGTEARLDLWRVHLVMGHLHGRYAIAGIELWREHPQLAQEVTRLLERLFGLDSEERGRSLDRYQLVKAFDVVERQRLDRLRAEGVIF
jgi:hypothetical protein